ncbi:MAG: TIGR03619 family F420-dependent LLM class oxidoreductase [Acidimicrobiales bacterium]|nr:TIGR03619 family F420-dependent LLM class oxidoreductase [Acidimicrobiales bacterium]
MRVSLGLPTHHVDVPDLLSADGIGRLAKEAEDLGFDAVYVTEHPFPADDWLASGGHHALDPTIALAVAATATTTIALHTNLFVPALRNPYLAAKAIASLDVVSGGRVILGVGAGYLEGEFDALGARFATRNDDLDVAIDAMRAAWTGTTVTDTSDRWKAVANTALPRPAQQPGPPVWVGGNSRRAMRRAVERGAGWSPFPAGGGMAAATRTTELRTPEQLRARVEEAHEHARTVGRTEPLDICFVPRGLAMTDDQTPDLDEVVASCEALAAVGCTWVAVSFPARSVEGQIESMRGFAEAVLPRVGALEPGLVYVP